MKKICLKFLRYPLKFSGHSPSKSSPKQTEVKMRLQMSTTVSKTLRYNRTTGTAWPNTENPLAKAHRVAQPAASHPTAREEHPNTSVPACPSCSMQGGPWPALTRGMPVRKMPHRNSEACSRHLKPVPVPIPLAQSL